MSTIADHRTILFRDKALADLTVDELRDAIAQTLDLLISDDPSLWRLRKAFTNIEHEESAAAPMGIKEHLAQGARLLEGALSVVTSQQAILQIRTGPRPAKCEDPDTGYALLTVDAADVLISNFPGAESPVTGDAEKSGTATYFRVYYADPWTCVMQGDVSDTHGDGDLRLESLIFTEGQPYTIKRHRLSVL